MPFPWGQRTVTKDPNYVGRNTVSVAKVKENGARAKGNGKKKAAKK
jgi:hypothetical protein